MENGIVYKPLVVYVVRPLNAFGVIRGSSFTSLWWRRKLKFRSFLWQTWIVVHKPLVAEKIEIQKPLMADVGRPLQAFGGGEN